MDDDRVLSGAHQQHLMSWKLNQAFSFIHYYTYPYDSNHRSLIVHITPVLGLLLSLDGLAFDYYSMPETFSKIRRRPCIITAWCGACLL